MSEYRKDIDGLRTISVAGVVLYHLGVSYLPGGYVGVDVFFVISGYLITGLIVRELDSTGRFDFKRFYIRRTRRLFPALFVTTTATLAVGAVLFPPAYLQSLGGSAAAALASGSNIYFYLQSGYFDVASKIKPLLHTWSLSVEEQFYLLWPAVLFFAFRSLKKNWALTVALISIASFVANLAFRSSPSAIFFLLPFRAFELGIGGLLVWAQPRWQPGRATSNALYGLGLLCILAAFLTFHEGMEFPSYNALLPCLGAALALYFAPTASASRLIANRPMVSVGRLSYSLYLAHWPLIVFYQYYVLRPLNHMEAAALLLATALAGAALYYGVEQHFRIRPNRPAWLSTRGFIGMAAASSAVLLCLSLSAARAGWTWRYPADLAAMMDESTARLGLEDRLSQCFLNDKTRKDIPEACYRPDPAFNKPTILLVGDSTANHLTLGLYEALKDRYQILVWSTASCAPLYQADLPPTCRSNNDEFFERLVKEYRYSLVVFSSHNAAHLFEKYFQKGAELLDRQGTDYVLVGQLITYVDRPAHLVARFADSDLREAMKSSLAYNCTEGEYGLDHVVSADRFFSMKKILCQGDGYPLFELGKKLVQVDTLHFTDVGSLYVGRALADWLGRNGHLH